MYKQLKNNIFSALKKERMGLSLIACALLVVAAISVLMVFYLAKLQEDDNRSQGHSLTRLAAEIPYDQLSSIKTRNTLKNIFYSRGQSNLAYIVLADKAGFIVSEVTSAGMAAPPFEISTAPTQWTGERHLMIGNKRVMEFYAPILSGAELKGYVRVGYFSPGLHSILEYIPYIATIILPVFLLTPLFYGLMRREVKPLQFAQAKIAEKLGDIQNTPAELSASGPLADFIDNFNEYIVQNKNRIECLESEKQQSDVSVRVLNYNFSRFEKILNVLPEAIIALDESGAPVCANTKVKTYLNLDVEQVLNTPVHSWGIDNTLKEFFLRCQKNGKSMQQPIKIKASDGVASSLTVQSTPVYHKNEHGSEFGGSIIIIKDDSAIDRAEDSKEQFISHVSHELKTPLNTMSMYSEALLGAEGADEEFRAEAINVIHDEVERMSELINNLLSITQLETGGMKLERHHVKTDDFLRDIFETMSKSDVGKGYKFELDIPNMVSSVAIDKDLMRIAINNILSNAIKYNKPDGRVSMRVEESDATIKIVIADTGIGISDADKEKIFNKFYRSDSEDVRERSGHGLGLALTKDIVNLHNGRLHVNSVPGEGTEFTVEFKKESNLLKWAS